MLMISPFRMTPAVCELMPECHRQAPVKAVMHKCRPMRERCQYKLFWSRTDFAFTLMAGVYGARNNSVETLLQTRPQRRYQRFFKPTPLRRVVEQSLIDLKLDPGVNGIIPLATYRRGQAV